MTGQNTTTAVERRRLSRQLGVERWAALSRPGVTRGLVALARDYAIVIAAFAWVVDSGSPVALVVALFVCGWAQHAIAILGHDAVHRSLVSSPKWNRWIGRWICLGPIGISFEGYRRIHFAHHRDVGRACDAERRCLPADVYGRGFRRHLPWTTAASSLCGGALGELRLHVAEMSPRSWREGMPPFVMPVVIGLVSLVTGHIEVALIWGLALPTTTFLFSRLRTWSEHIGDPALHRIRSPWWLRPFAHPHHVDHHWEHHLWPSIPSHRLPQVRRAIPSPPVVDLMEHWDRLADASRVEVLPDASR